MTDNSATGVPGPATGVPSIPDEDPDDASYGWAMFFLFTAAVLAITFAVCVLALVPSWWMLGVVYATDLGVTGIVFKIVLGAFVSPEYTDLGRAESAPRAVPVQAAAPALATPRSPAAAHH